MPCSAPASGSLLTLLIAGGSIALGGLVAAVLPCQIRQPALPAAA